MYFVSSASSAFIPSSCLIFIMQSNWQIDFNFYSVSFHLLWFPLNAPKHLIFEFIVFISLIKSIKSSCSKLWFLKMSIRILFRNWKIILSKFKGSWRWFIIFWILFAKFIIVKSRELVIFLLLFLFTFASKSYKIFAALVRPFLNLFLILV